MEPQELLVMMNVGEPVTWEDINSVVASIDKDGSGDLDHKEFEVAMKRLGLGLTADQIKQCIEVLDTDGDGRISTPFRYLAPRGRDTAKATMYLWAKIDHLGARTT